MKPSGKPYFLLSSGLTRRSTYCDTTMGPRVKPEDDSALFRFSLLTLGATFVLLLIGGLVNPMGASLACPDWYFFPTCNGELFPAMEGGVLYEHGHRLWASFVGLLTLVLAGGIFVKRRRDKKLFAAGLFAVLLIGIQGGLGGLTVLLGLNAVLSTLHLACGILFFCLLVFISFRLSNAEGLLFKKMDSSFLPVLTIHAIFAQIILGGALRHLGAGLACGDDWISCGLSFWPTWSLGQLHMLHRIFGYGLFLLVSFSCIVFFQQIKKRIAFLPMGLLVIQIISGLATVAYLRPINIVVLHTGMGALVLASLFGLLLKASHTRIQLADR